MGEPEPDRATERDRRGAIRLAQHQVPRLTTLTPDPPHGVIPPTPPGPEGSKGTRALTGVRGVPYSPVRMS